MKLIQICIYFCFAISLHGQDFSSKIDSIPNNGQIDHVFSYSNSLKKISNNKVLIANSINQTMVFYVSLEKKNWQAFSLRPNQNVTINIEPNDIAFFKIHTDNYYRENYIRGGDRYAIQYDFNSRTYYISNILFE